MLNITGHEDQTRTELTSDGRAGKEEAQLVREATNGCNTAINQLIDRYEAMVFRLARKITSNYEDAEEVKQSAFEKAFRNLANFRGQSSFRTWLGRIAINEALMKIRERRHKEVSIDEQDQDCAAIFFRELRDCEPNPEQRYSREELRWIILTKGMAELDPRYRMVLQLHDIEGFTIKETALALSLSVTATKTRLLRARMRLRDSVECYFRRARSKTGLWISQKPLHPLAHLCGVTPQSGI